MEHPEQNFDANAAVQELARLNASVDDLLRRWARLGSGRTATRVVATDDSGVATAELSPTGEIVRIELDRDWKAQLQPQALGAACTAAVTAALTERAGELQEQPAPAAAPQPEVESHPDPRPLQDISDQTDLIMQQALAYVPPSPAETSTPTESVVVRLIGGQAMVHIDPEWARGTSTAAINAALAEALESPTREPQPDTEPLRDLNSRLDGLFAEALTHLRNLS